MRKKLLIALIGIGIVSFGGLFFLIGKQVVRVVKSYYASHSDYKPMSKNLVMEQKRFVVLITSHNTEEFVEKNMRSVLEQNYDNFRIVFIDNGSSDRSFSKAGDWVRRYKMTPRTKFVRRGEKTSTTELLYFAIQEMNNQEIVVLLDGKDWFSHTEVLNELNRYYNDPHVWLTYAQYSNFPEYEKGNARSPILHAKKQLVLRASPWIYSHYCTFYAGLFKRIKMRDLLYEGSFFQYKTNRAILMPMLEMSEEHAIFIPSVLYVNNRKVQKEMSQEEVKSIRSYSRYIRSLRPYNKLTQHPKYEIASNQEVDLFIFSSDRPLQLYSFLESQKKCAPGINDVYVIFSASEEKYMEGYELVRRTFPEVCFIHKGTKSSSLKSDLMAQINKVSSDYVAVAEDQLILKDQVDLNRAVSLLEKTGAYGVYFSLGLNLSSLPKQYYNFIEGAIAWQFNQGKDDWGHSHSMGMVIYRKSDLIDSIARLSFQSIPSFQKAFVEMSQNDELGVCFTDSKSVFNFFEIFRVKEGGKKVAYTTKELNDLFLEGMKLDIRPLYRIQNKETNVSKIPHFVNQ